MAKQKSPGLPLPMAFVLAFPDGVQVAVLGQKVVQVGYPGETFRWKNVLSDRHSIEKAMKQAYGGKS